jgi:hypothetical protein
VAIEGRAVLFVGRDGAGKSTAAAEMCIRHDAQLFADDAVSLDVGPSNTYVLPSEENHWLTRESCLALGLSVRRRSAPGHKRDFRASNLARQSSPLALVIALRFDPTVERAAFREVRGGDAARFLLDTAIRFDVEDVDARRREFDQIATIHHRASVLELVRPLHSPGGVAALVLEALRKGTP